MQIAIVKNNTVIQIGDYRELFPNTSFPANGPDAAWMQENNCLGVTVFKAHTNTEKLVNSSPYIENNQVFTVTVAPKTDEELASELNSSKAKVRSQRDALLASTDWTQLTDAPVNSAAWATYRQALRDIPNQAGFPVTVTWPKNPIELAKEQESEEK